VGSDTILPVPAQGPLGEAWARAGGESPGRCHCSGECHLRAASPRGFNGTSVHFSNILRAGNTSTTLEGLNACLCTSSTWDSEEGIRGYEGTLVPGKSSGLPSSSSGAGGT